MKNADQGSAILSAQAILIDPGTMTVVWVNEAASEALPDRGRDSVPGAAVDKVFPLAGQLGVPEALRAVAETGATEHLRADVVAMSRRSVSLVVSIHRLPDGTLLLLAEHALRGHEAAAARGSRRSRHP